MVHGGFEVPRLPPVGRFLGDALTVVVSHLSSNPLSETSHSERGLRFTADATNREGMLTELLAQRVPCAHALPKAKSYLSLGFAAMEAGVPVDFPVGLGGTYCCAVKFVEAATGRQTGIYEIGRAGVGLG